MPIDRRSPRRARPTGAPLTPRRARRDALVRALAGDARGDRARDAAGLHATVQLRAADDEAAILAAAQERRIALATMSAHRMAPDPGPPVLLLGYGQVPEAAIRPGVREVAAAVRAARARR
jgi:GntR family transcriptional regulator/MocR family aminotransferase